MNFFLTSVSASAREYSCAPQYQQMPPLFAQTYCRLILLTDKEPVQPCSFCSFISVSTGNWPTASSTTPNSIPPAYVQIEAAYRKADHFLDKIIQLLTWLNTI